MPVSFCVWAASMGEITTKGTNLDIDRGPVGILIRQRGKDGEQVSDKRICIFAFGWRSDYERTL